MGAIASHYNLARHKRRVTNYRIFPEKLGTPLLTVEFSFDGNFELKNSDADMLMQISEAPRSGKKRHGSTSLSNQSRRL